MKPIRRASRRQMQRMAEKIFKNVASNKALFPAPPIDMQAAQYNAAMLQHELGGPATPNNIMARETMMLELMEQMKLLQQYIIEQRRKEREEQKEK
jgi:hypothetical protein